MNVEASKVIARLSKVIGDQQVTIALLQVQIDELKQRDQDKRLDREGEGS